jgi:serine/threonine-protein kinase
MFELIAGRVPFPLNDKGETARNHVMLSHMEDPLPDLMLLRKHNLPQGWTKEQKQREMMVPQWLVETIVKCLEKKPVNRFANGSELHSHLLLQLAKSAAAQAQMAIAEPIKTSVTTEEETTETEAVYVASKADSVYQRNLAAQERLRRENEAVLSSYPKPRRGLSRPAIIGLAMLLALVAIGGYTLIANQNKSGDEMVTAPLQVEDDSVAVENNDIVLAKNESREKKKADSIKNRKRQKEQDSLAVAPVIEQEPDSAVSNEEEPPPQKKEQVKEEVKEENAPEEDDKPKSNTKYKVINVAHFHNEPDESTRRAAFINHWNNAILSPQREKNGFIYIVYTNDKGQTSRGWLSKKDLKALGE